MTDRFVAFAFAAADLLVEVDPAGRIAFAAGAFRTRFGADPERFVGRFVEELAAGEDRAQLAAAVPLLAGRGRLQPTVIRLSDPERTPVVLSGLAMPEGGAGAPALCLTFGPMPQGLAAAEVADKDSFARAAEARLRDQDRPAMLGLVELDGAGAQAIAERPGIEAQLRAELLRDLDGAACVGELAQGRWGVLQDEGADVAALAERVEAALRRFGIGAQVTAVALSLAPGEMTDVQAVRALRAALSGFARGGQEALAKAGVAGGLSGFLTELAARAEGIGRVIAEGRFRLDYQPILRLSDRGVHHYEALLRPTGGLPRADEFVSLAEAAGLAEELDLAVLRQALKDSRGKLPVAVNVSGLSAQSHAFRDRMLALIGQEPRGLFIEITETADFEHEEEALAFMDAMRARNVPVCIDDFGAGSAAFRHLRQLRPDYVKIDGSYVTAATRQERERAFVASMAELSRAAGAKVVAERIETEEEAALMASLGVEFGQGWLFGRPAPLPGSIPTVRRNEKPREVWE
ncbi:MAG: EAL domain-containing protein [Acetobacteraceae bacterium]|nr:EAL domain-containing protein [Acetobacteraceae bacterium]MDW8398524.1 EAL domain-containing protein [Acetobacteraceae bacterium]